MRYDPLLGAALCGATAGLVVEVFRATLQTLSALTLAARVQYGLGPGSEPAQIAELIRSLRGRGLTDGQWFAIVREMLRPWSGAPGSYPLPALVTLVHGKSRSSRSSSMSSWSCVNRRQWRTGLPAPGPRSWRSSTAACPSSPRRQHAPRTFTDARESQGHHNRGPRARPTKCPQPRRAVT